VVKLRRGLVKLTMCSALGLDERYKKIKNKSGGLGFSDSPTEPTGRVFYQLDNPSNRPSIKKVRVWRFDPSVYQSRGGLSDRHFLTSLQSYDVASNICQAQCPCPPCRRHTIRTPLLESETESCDVASDVSQAQCPCPPVIDTQFEPRFLIYMESCDVASEICELAQ